MNVANPRRIDVLLSCISELHYDHGFFCLPCEVNTDLGPYRCGTSHNFFRLWSSVWHVIVDCQIKQPDELRNEPCTLFPRTCVVVQKNLLVVSWEAYNIMDFNVNATALWSEKELISFTAVIWWEVTRSIEGTCGQRSSSTGKNMGMLYI